MPRLSQEVERLPAARTAKPHAEAWEEKNFLRKSSGIAESHSREGWNPLSRGVLACWTAKSRRENMVSACVGLDAESVDGGAPAQPLEKVEELRGWGAGQGHWTFVFGVAEGEFHAGQQQPVQAKIFTEEAVLPTVSAQHVTDERVADVGEVAADLMGAAG